MAADKEDNQDDAITRQLNEIYDEADSSIDPELIKMQARSWLKEDWQSD